MKMKGLFNKLFTGILRKEYLVECLKVGKMRDLEQYIDKKNKKLLYFAD